MKVKSFLDAAPPIWESSVRAQVLDDELKSRRRGSEPAARLALRGPDMRAPLSRSRPSFRRCRLPVGDRPRVGGLGLLGELALGVAHLLPRRPDAGVGALQRRGAGADLEQPQLLGGQRRLRVGVVLAAGEQAPEQARRACARRRRRRPGGRGGRGRARRRRAAGRAGGRPTRPPRPAPMRADAEPCLEIRPCAPALLPDWRTRGSRPR